MNSCIYAIVNLNNQRHYVGSAVNFEKRKSVHLTELRGGYHHNPKLQHTFDKYGESIFRFDVMERVPKDRLIEREQFWMDQTLPFYNCARVAGSSLGIKWSQESRNRICGVPKPPINEVTRERIRSGLRGRAISAFCRSTLIECNRTRVWSDNAKDTMRASKQKYLYRLTSPTGKVFETNSLKNFCRSHDVTESAMGNVVHGRRSQHKGWTGRIVQQPETAIAV